MPALLLETIRLVREEIEAFERRDHVLRSGRRLENLDAVILATGFKAALESQISKSQPLLTQFKQFALCDLCWPQINVLFLEREVLDIRANQLLLYKLMFVPARGPHQTLALIGFVQPLGTTFCMAKLQERLAALVFQDSTLIVLMTAQTLAVSKQHVLLILYCECFFNLLFKHHL